MNINSISDKIKASLTRKEYDYLVKIVRDEHITLLNNLILTPSTPADIFIYDTELFLNELMKDFNANTIISEDMIVDFKEFDNLVKRLASFSIVEIKDILIRLLNFSKNGIYDSLVSDFIRRLEQFLSDSDFELLLKDKPLSDYY